MEKKKHICECGKEFSDPQSFNGHKSHCKEHLMAVNKYNDYLLRQKNAQQLAIKSHSEKAKLIKQLVLQQWISEQHKCERCGKVMTEKYGSGRFCSEACAKARVHTEETKNKLRISCTKAYETKFSHEYCSICGKRLDNRNITGICANCLHNTPEGKAIMQANGKLSYNKALAAGKTKPWQSRKIKSYAEIFWEKVLENNNILFSREQPVKHNNSNYFIDFLIKTPTGLLDLEIDGKQHKYPERVESDQVRDTYLKSLNYIIYRIDWNNINTEDGKQLMTEKINKFLVFYNSLLV